jgi:DUF1680 family protein
MRCHPPSAPPLISQACSTFRRRAIFGVCFLLCTGTAGFCENHVTSTLHGPLEPQIHAVIANWLLVAPERNPAMLGMFADRDTPPYRDLLPWSGEFAGKYLTACAQMVQLTGDATLRAKTAEFVRKLVSLQDTDGYLGPFPKEHRLTGTAPHRGSMPTWDAWGHYHIMLGLLLWHEITSDQEALRAAQRIGDLLCARFLGADKRVFDIGSPDQNQAIIHGLCLLFEKAHAQRYLDLAKEIVEEFEIRGAGDYLRTALAGAEFYTTPKPRWESLHAILGLNELYRITGEENYRRAFAHIWWSIAKLDRHNNGGFSSGEQAVGNPYHGAAIETCCTIAWLAMSIEMLRTTHNPVAADELELTTLNSVVGLHAPDGSWTTYNTPMDGRRIPNTKDISFQIRPGSEQLNCCSVNAARGFGMISDWGLLRAEDRDGLAQLVLHWFGSSTFTTDVRATKVTLDQVTDYPRSGKIILKISPDIPVTFALNLRVPAWSEKTLIEINGEPIEAHAGSYCVLSREWKKGDEVAIHLDMRLRGWLGERECAGKVALYRGPILLACEPENPGALEQLDLATLTIDSIDESSAGTIVALNVRDASGRKLHLRDFGTAGQNGKEYVSWLPSKGGTSAPFSRTNPLRTRCLEP